MAFFFRAQVDYVGAQSVGATIISIDGVHDENTYVGKQYLLDRGLTGGTQEVVERLSSKWSHEFLDYPEDLGNDDLISSYNTATYFAHYLTGSLSITNGSDTYPNMFSVVGGTVQPAGSDPGGVPENVGLKISTTDQINYWYPLNNADITYGYSDQDFIIKINFQPRRNEITTNGLYTFLEIYGGNARVYSFGYDNVNDRFFYRVYTSASNHVTGIARSWSTISSTFYTIIVRVIPRLSSINFYIIGENGNSISLVGCDPYDGYVMLPVSIAASLKNSPLNASYAFSGSNNFPGYLRSYMMSIPKNPLPSYSNRYQTVFFAVYPYLTFGRSSTAPLVRFNKEMVDIGADSISTPANNLTPYLSPSNNYYISGWRNSGTLTNTIFALKSSTSSGYYTFNDWYWRIECEFVFIGTTNAPTSVGGAIWTGSLFNGSTIMLLISQDRQRIRLGDLLVNTSSWLSYTPSTIANIPFQTVVTISPGGVCTLYVRNLSTGVSYTSSTTLTLGNSQGRLVYNFSLGSTVSSYNWAASSVVYRYFSVSKRSATYSNPYCGFYDFTSSATSVAKRYGFSETINATNAALPTINLRRGMSAKTVWQTSKMQWISGSSNFLSPEVPLEGIEGGNYVPITRISCVVNINGGEPSTPMVYNRPCSLLQYLIWSYSGYSCSSGNLVCSIVYDGEGGAVLQTGMAYYTTNVAYSVADLYTLPDITQPQSYYIEWKFQYPSFTASIYNLERVLLNEVDITNLFTRQTLDSGGGSYASRLGFSIAGAGFSNQRVSINYPLYSANANLQNVVVESNNGDMYYVDSNPEYTLTRILTYSGHPSEYTAVTLNMSKSFNPSNGYKIYINFAVMTAGYVRVLTIHSQDTSSTPREVQVYGDTVTQELSVGVMNSEGSTIYQTFSGVFKPYTFIGLTMTYDSHSKTRVDAITGGRSKTLTNFSPINQSCRYCYINGEKYYDSGKGNINYESLTIDN